MFKQKNGTEFNNKKLAKLPDIVEFIENSTGIVLDIYCLAVGSIILTLVRECLFEQCLDLCHVFQTSWQHGTFDLIAKLQVYYTWKNKSIVDELITSQVRRYEFPICAKTVFTNREIFRSIWFAETSVTTTFAVH